MGVLQVFCCYVCFTLVQISIKAINLLEKSEFTRTLLKAWFNFSNSNSKSVVLETEAEKRTGLFDLNIVHFRKLNLGIVTMPRFLLLQFSFFFSFGAFVAKHARLFCASCSQLCLNLNRECRDTLDSFSQRVCKKFDVSSLILKM